MSNICWDNAVKATIEYYAKEEATKAERERIFNLLSKEFGDQMDGLDGRDIVDWLSSQGGE